LRLASMASFHSLYASACTLFSARRSASLGTGGGEARTSLIPCRNDKHK
jgi:hypothetical protein